MTIVYINSWMTIIDDLKSKMTYSNLKEVTEVRYT